MATEKTKCYVRNENRGVERGGLIALPNNTSLMLSRLEMWVRK